MKQIKVVNTPYIRKSIIRTGLNGVLERVAGLFFRSVDFDGESLETLKEHSGGKIVFISYQSSHAPLMILVHLLRKNGFTVPDLALDFTGTEFDTKSECQALGLRFSDADTPFPDTLRYPVGGSWTHEPTRGWRPYSAVSLEGPAMLLPLMRGANWQLNTDFEFHIYATTGTDLLFPLAEKSDGRLKVNKAIPREQLLQKLAKMDFLVNLLVKGTETKQVPSKLIDYGLTGRPILNINPLNPEIEHINQFLKKDYSFSYKVQNLEQYNIKNVALQFLALAKD